MSLTSQQDARPQIIFALVARGADAVLAEYTGAGVTGNFQQATYQMMQKLDPTVEWKSYTCGEQAFHYIIDAEVWYVCMADRTMERRMPFALLAAVQETFKQRYRPEEVASAPAYGMNHEFKEDIAMLMDRYNSPDADRVTSMTAKVQQVNDGLMESMDKLLDRQDKIELLVNRSHLLSESSASLTRESVRLHRTVRYKNIKTYIIMGTILFIAVVIVIWASVR